jgi:hypothetical protein
MTLIHLTAELVFWSVHIYFTKWYWERYPIDSCKNFRSYIPIESCFLESPNFPVAHYKLARLATAV